MTVASRSRELFKIVLLLMSSSSILASGYDDQSGIPFCLVTRNYGENKLQEISTIVNLKTIAYLRIKGPNQPSCGGVLIGGDGAGEGAGLNLENALSKIRRFSL